MSIKGRSNLLKLKQERFNKLLGKMFPLQQQQDTESCVVMLQWQERTGNVGHVSELPGEQHLGNCKPFRHQPWDSAVLTVVGTYPFVQNKERTRAEKKKM